MISPKKLGLMVVGVVMALSGVAVGKARDSSPDDVPPEFAYTKTPRYHRFMALIHAAEKGDVRSVRKWLRSGVNVDGKDVDDGMAPAERPLAVAAEHGHLEVVNVLLAAGARPDWCSGSCVTALHYAIRGRYTKIVARLLDAGADPKIPYDGELSTVELARRTGDPEIVKLLEEHLTGR